MDDTFFFRNNVEELEICCEHIWACVTFGNEGSVGRVIKDYETNLYIFM
jgi:hypothetical protein